MMYRQLAEEASRLQRDTGIQGITIRLGDLTPSEEQELINEIGGKPTVSAVLSWETLKTLDYTDDVYFSYAIPTTKESEIAELESKLAKLKGEMINA